MTIYLSSTYEDLNDYRRVVFDALRKAGYTVIAMEDYVAMDQRPVDKCLADVARTDIYVGLFAFRYGYIPPSEHKNPSGLSITELELRYAERLEKPCFIFVASEKASWPTEFNDAWKGKGEIISRLRNYLQTEKLASFFSSPHELATLVITAVNNYRQESAPSAAETTAPSPAITWNIEEKGSPFPGLMHFTKRFAPVFFGRAPEVREILDRMYAPEGRFIIVSGSSGTGKSSLVEAGVLPKLEEIGLPGDKRCLCLRIVPSQGNHPFDALMRPLHEYAERAEFDPYKLGEELVTKPAIFTKRIQTIINKGINKDALVLFVDQMEELFTIGKKEGDTEQYDAFLSALYQGVNSCPLWVISTIRSDFLHHCYHHPNMLKVLRGPGHYLLGRVETYMMRDMIAKPAQRAGLAISENFVRQLIQDTGSEPGNLPLLAFVLRRLYDKRQGNTLSEDVYKDFGGVGGAIADHINKVEEKLTIEIGSEALNLLPRIFPSLLRVDVEGHITRQRASLAWFSNELQPVVNLLIKERLLSAEGEREKASVSVAHEKLFDTWSALVNWIAENKDDLRVLRQAELEAREWKKHAYDPKYLWHEDRLRRLQKIIKRQSGCELDALVRQYAWPQDRLSERFGTIPPSYPDRQVINEWLSIFDDMRRGTGLTIEDVPDIDWVEIPGGKVLLEGIEGTFKVKPFHIARFPVTNIQFQAFIDAEDGFSKEIWWTDLVRSESPKLPNWSEPNHPRETVSWNEAVAFCRWLSVRLGYEVKLPTEWEWQQAASGGNSRNIYPWGPEWDASCCNSSESSIRRTTPVDKYPNGSSLQGVMDMVGNIFEWCFNKYSNSKGISTGGKDRRVWRGGSWRYYQVGASAPYRFNSKPDFRSNDLGFRVCCLSPIKSNTEHRFSEH